MAIASAQEKLAEQARGFLSVAFQSKDGIAIKMRALEDPMLASVWVLPNRER